MSDFGNDGGIARAEALLSLRRHNEALDAVTRHFDPTSERCWFVRTAALYDLGRVAESREAAALGLAVAPESTSLLHMLALADLRDARLANAENIALRALGIAPEDPALLSLYARIVATAGQTGKARRLVERALASDPEHHDALYLAGALDYSEGKDDDAVARWRDALRADPESPHVHSMIGAVLHDKGDVDPAAPHLLTSVRNDPTVTEYAQTARENAVWRHWMMKPLWPIRKWGMAGAMAVGLGVMVAGAILDGLGFEMAAAWVGGAVGVWLFYTLTVPWIVRAIVERKRLG